MSRKGKIARLPIEIRTQLNRRIEDGEPGKLLVEWLNSLPSVQEVLRSQFDSRPINEPNLSGWKQGGYRDWVAQQETLAQAREIVHEGGQLAEAGHGRLSDNMATILVARYATVIAALNTCEIAELDQDLRVLDKLCRHITELRRGDHNAIRIKFQQARIERTHDKHEMGRQLTRAPACT